MKRQLCCEATQGLFTPLGTTFRAVQKTVPVQKAVPVQKKLYRLSCTKALTWWEHNTGPVDFQDTRVGGYRAKFVVRQHSGSLLLSVQLYARYKKLYRCKKLYRYKKLPSQLHEGHNLVEA